MMPYLNIRNQTFSKLLLHLKSVCKLKSLNLETFRTFIRISIIPLSQEVYTMKIFFQIALLLLATAFSLTLLSQFTNYSIVLLTLLALIGMAGLLFQKKMYNKFLQQFKFIHNASYIVIPDLIKNTNAVGMELAFIFLLASIGINPVTDLIEGKIKTNWSYNVLFFDLALVSVVFAIFPILIYIFYYAMKNPE